MNHLKHHQIDYQKWDNCILNAANSLVYAESWFLDIVSPNWEALVLGDYEYVMPLPVKRKFGIPFLVQPPLTQQLGVFSKNSIDENIIELFIQKIPYRSYHLNFNELNPYNKGIQQPNYLLELSKDYDTLYSGFSQNTKRNIKKAQQSGIYISDNIEPEYFLDFYFSAMCNEAMPNRNLTKKIVTKGYEKNKLRIYAAFTAENELCSVLALLHSKKRWIYLLAASDTFGKESSAMALIVDKVIQNEAETDSFLDFEGSKVEGIARFYQGFGAKPSSFLQIRKNSVITLLNMFKKK